MLVKNELKKYKLVQECTHIPFDHTMNFLNSAYVVCVICLVICLVQPREGHHPINLN